MFKVNISDPQNGKTFKSEVKDPQARRLLGLRIGDTFDGGIVGLPGYELQITGGTDRDGFPMRDDLAGTGRHDVLLARGPGYRPKRKGERRRKKVRGNTISEVIVQINTKIVKRGEKPVEELLKPPS
jgi:small subunit ribosomal protein S6e